MEQIQFFSEALNSIIPFFVTVLCCAVFNLAFVLIFNVNSFNDGFEALISHIFYHLGRNFGSSFLFLFLVHFLWMFGIHGNNVMQGVAEKLFFYDETDIFCKPLFDVFCLEGGSGCTWCYILAVLIFVKHRRDKQLESLALLPSIFNINEIIVFGLPIIYNPVFVIPFICTPLIFFCTTMFWYKIGFLTTIQPVE